MNREVKFRVWDANPAFGFPKSMYHNAIVGRGIVVATIDEDEFNDENLEPNYMTMDNSNGAFIIMQFTGLQDKNGVDIYDGDILKTESSDKSIYTEVLFGETFEFMKDEGYYGWYLKSSSNEYCQLNSSIKHTSEVIGNIYENPDLK